MFREILFILPLLLVSNVAASRDNFNSFLIGQNTYVNSFNDSTNLQQYDKGYTLNLTNDNDFTKGFTLNSYVTNSFNGLADESIVYNTYDAGIMPVYALSTSSIDYHYNYEQLQPINDYRTSRYYFIYEYTYDYRGSYADLRGSRNNNIAVYFLSFTTNLRGTLFINVSGTYNGNNLNYNTTITLNSATSEIGRDPFIYGVDVYKTGTILPNLLSEQLQSTSISISYIPNAIGVDNYDAGYETGYNAGYNVGYNQGASDTDHSFMSLLGNIADTPVLMLRGLFNFDLFGLRVYTIVFGLITALVVLWIIKKVV